MKTLLFFGFSFFLTMHSMAQDIWKISLNEKIIFSASAENQEKNIVNIKSSDLQKKKEFSLVYTEKPKKTDWIRSIIVVGEDDHELLREENSKIKIKNAALDSLFAKSKTLKIYTISLPKDPAKRATVRVRRVHLCTVIKQ
ncbi:MAG: hypothetical protein ACJ75F_04430 [Flavisolibacter sp.]